MSELTRYILEKLVATQHRGKQSRVCSLNRILSTEIDFINNFKTKWRSVFMFPALVAGQVIVHLQS